MINSYTYLMTLKRTMRSKSHFEGNASSNFYYEAIIKALVCSLLDTSQKERNLEQPCWIVLQPT